MNDIRSQGFKFLIALIVGLMIASNSADALRDVKESRYFRFGIDVTFTIYWTLVMAKIVL